MATSAQIVDALLLGFEHQDHPSVQAALDHLVVLIELYYKPEVGAAPRENIRYEAIRETLNIFRINPLSAIHRLMQELHDLDEDDQDISIAVQILVETIEKITTVQPVVMLEDLDDDVPPPPATPAPNIGGTTSPESPPDLPESKNLQIGDKPDTQPVRPKRRMEAPPSQPEPDTSAAPGAPSAGSPLPAPAPSQAERSEDEDMFNWMSDFSEEDESAFLEEPAAEEAPDLMADDKTLTGDPEWLKSEVRRQKFITQTGTFDVVVDDDDTSELPKVDTEEAQASERDTEETSTAREAHFSAYFPPEIQPEVSYGLYVYAHTAEALEAIKQNVAQFKDQLGGEVPEAAMAESHTALKYGTLLTVVPEADHAVFDPPQQTRTWNNDWTRFEFDFIAEDTQQPALDIRLSIQIAGIEIAHIDCLLNISEASESPRRSFNPLVDARLRAVTSRMYQKIFVSYSRRDNLIAERYRLAQMAAGQDVFMDSYSIRAGEDWQAALARAIDEADVFQLFWSENAAQSENVRDEWEYALGYRCPDDRCVRFIRPVFWLKPLPTPPTELAHLNFKFVPFQGIEEAETPPPVTAQSTSPAEVMQRLDALDNRMTAIEDSLEIIKHALRAIYHRLKE